MNVSSRSPGKILMSNFEIPTIIMLVPEIPDLKMVDPDSQKGPSPLSVRSNAVLYINVMSRIEAQVQ
jgi:hypothetical protein